jgi:hypothetical protein
MTPSGLIGLSPWLAWRVDGHRDLPAGGYQELPLAATSVAECDCPTRCGAPGTVDRRGALLLSDPLGDHPDEGLCISWERSSFE